MANLIVTNAELGRKLDELADAMKEHSARDEVQFDKILTIFNGNGIPGVKTRLDRLEIADATRRKREWWLWMALAGGAVTTLYTYILRWLQP